MIVDPSEIEALSRTSKPGTVGFAANIASGRATEYIIGAAADGGRDARLDDGSIARSEALSFFQRQPENFRRPAHATTSSKWSLEEQRSGTSIGPRTKADIKAQAANLLGSKPGIS